MKVLITGGAGYVGSTIASCCADAGHRPVVLDDLSQGLRAFGERFPFYCGDIADEALLGTVFAKHPDIEAVVHCAARNVVPESIADPLGYYEDNVAKAIPFLRSILASRCRRVVFSSTAALYAPGPDLVVDEGSPIDPRVPYAASKSMLERILRDVCAATDLAALSLRYFNPLGADPLLRSGLQLASPTHALGKIIEAHRTHQPFTVTGTDWPTRDGSGLRDYVHVWDLARAHVAALERFPSVLAAAGDRFDVVNLGSGSGTTVYELVAAFRAATGADLAVVAGPPRPGDLAGCSTRTDKAAALLGWRARLTLGESVRDALAWSELLPSILDGSASPPG